jgi:hypothetical protein
MDFVSLVAYTFVKLKEIQVHRPYVETRMNVKGYTICDGLAEVGS